MKSYIEHNVTGAKSEVNIFYDLKNYQVSLVSKKLGNYSWNGVDFLDSYNKMRIFLEQNNFLLLTNGSKKNCWASGFLRDSSNGLLTYLLQDDENPYITLNIFEFSDINIVSLNEQKEFYMNWLSKKKKM